jgi:hypothetical protein
MKLGQLAAWLLALTCAMPAVFFGAAYLINRHRIDVPVDPYVVLAGWVFAALYLYWAKAFQAFNAREALKFVVYCGILCGLGFIGATVSFWSVVFVYGE